MTSMLWYDMVAKGKDVDFYGHSSVASKVMYTPNHVVSTSLMSLLLLYPEP